MSSLYKRKGSSFWWMKIYANNRVVRESTRTVVKDEAVTILKMREGQIAMLARIDVLEAELRKLKAKI